MMNERNTGAVVLDTPEGIKWYLMRAQLGAAKLELLGMRHSSGRSVLAQIKRNYKFKGNRQSVYDQFAVLVQEQFNR